MKKYLIGLAVTCIISSQSCVFASGYSSTGPVKVAIKKYKNGNYTGCLQDMQSIVKKDPSNAVAYYYMAMSYANAGRKDQAISSYQKVLTLRPNPQLSNYAETGKRCLETPEKCTTAEASTDLDKAVSSSYIDGVSTKVKQDLDKKRLDMLKNKINTDEEINNYELQKFKDYTKHRSDASTDNSKLQADAQKQPTNEEIVAALRVLNKAGLNPYTQTTAVNPYAQMQTQAAVQNPEMAQLNMMLGNNNQGSNRNDAMMNMLPYMMAQQGQSGQAAAGGYNPQIIQAMMMNSMMPDFTMNTDSNNK